MRVRFSGAKIWNTLPLALRSGHDLNKFGFGLKRHLRSKPNWASNTIVILSCSNFLSVIVFCVVVFFFSSGPHSNQPRWTGHPWIKCIQIDVQNRCPKFPMGRTFFGMSWLSIDTSVSNLETNPIVPRFFGVGLFEKAWEISYQLVRAWDRLEIMRLGKSEWKNQTNHSTWEWVLWLDCCSAYTMYLQLREYGFFMEGNTGQKCYWIVP